MPRHLIIGYGSIGKRHSTLLKAKGEEVIDVDIGWYLSENEWNGIDMVWICTPNEYHYPHAMEAIERGKRVFIEKPITSTLGEAREIQKAGGNVWVACNMRFHPAIQILKDNLDSVGNVLYSNMYFSHYLPYQRENWKEYMKDTNIFLDAGWHYVDLALWLFGGNIYSKKAIHNKDMATMAIAHLNNSFTTINLDYLRRDKFCGITIVGTEGTLEWRSNFKEQPYNSIEFYIKDSCENFAIGSSDMYNNQIDFLLKNPTASNIDETISVMEICS